MLLVFALTQVVIPFEVEKGTRKVEIYYSPDGKDWYPVGVYRYPFISSSIKDTFRWVVKGEPPKGGIRIKVVAYFSGGEVKEKEVKDIEVKVEKDAESGYYCHRRKTVIDSSDTLYSWRMLGYDAQHTGYYPFPLYPPLELRWEYGKPHPEYGSPDYTMVSACAGNGMLYVRSDWTHCINWVVALDIETGEEVWARELTSNVWTCALSAGDSLLFVGTSISWNTQEPTFFCIDALSGEIRWSVSLATVEYSPIVVDTIVYFSNLQGDVYAYTLKGKEVWKESLTAPLDASLYSPCYFDNKIYIGGETGVLLCLDAYTGNFLWAYEADDWVYEPIAFSSRIVFSTARGTIYCVDEKWGNLIWKIDTIPTSIRCVKGNILIGGVMYWLVQDSVLNVVLRRFDGETGEMVWADTFYGRYTGIGSITITSNDLIWVSGDWIFAFDLDSGEMVYQSDSVGNPASWLCFTCYFPILYKRNLIAAHRGKIFVFEGNDTFVDPYNISGVYVYPEVFDREVNIRVKADEVRVYDVLGRERAVLSGERDFFGYLNLRWDGKDKEGKEVPSGVYFLVGHDEDLIRRGKVIRLKRR